MPPDTHTPDTHTKDSLAFLSHDAARPSALDQVDDSLLVEQARIQLGLLEFDFFRAAWRQWCRVEGSGFRVQKKEGRARKPESTGYPVLSC